MWGVVWRALNFYFGNHPLNKNELDQPAPLEVQRQHLKKQLANIERQILNREQNEQSKSESIKR